jgi:flavodoxin
MKKGIIAMMAGAAVALTGCTAKTASNAEQEAAPKEKVLVLYYSQTGTTKIVAEELQRQLGADIAAVEAVDPYPEDYDATIERWKSELDKGVKPEIKPVEVNLGDYDTIFLGFPVWGGTYALPMATFVEQNAEQLKGKKIVAFATYGSGGLDSSTADLEKALPESTVVKGYGVRTIRVKKAREEINRFLIENGYKEGTIDPLPEYSEQAPVTDEETAIFNKACGDYKFPLGTPETVGKRVTATSTDYKFTAAAKQFDGTPATFTIYVTVEQGADPVFTLVER